MKPLPSLENGRRRSGPGWSVLLMQAPWAFLALVAALPPVRAEEPTSKLTALILTEIQYHPATRLDGANLAFVELVNTEAVEMDLTGYRLGGDLEYAFPAGTRLAPGARRVVAADPAALAAAYGLSGVLGPWSGVLPHDRGRVHLLHPAGGRLLQVEYQDREPWPVAADGSGHSLVLRHPGWGENDPRAWSASAYLGGSPGAADPAAPVETLLLNEFAANTDDPVRGLVSNDWVEILNLGPGSAALRDLYLSDDPSEPAKWRLPDQTLASGQRVVFDEATGFHRDLAGFGLRSAGEALVLSRIAGTAQDRVVDALRFDGQVKGGSAGRSPDGAPEIAALSTPTPGQPNAAPAAGPVVINEIHYHPVEGGSAGEFVELHNRGAAPVDLGGWRLDGAVSFSLPPGTTLPAGGYLVVANQRDQFLGRVPAEILLGDLSGSLANSGEVLRLVRPVVSPLEETVWIEEDRVPYSDSVLWGRWADGGGSSLELRDPHSDNARPSNWAASGETSEAPWTLLERTAPLEFGNDVPERGIDELEILLRGAGECLLDQVEVIDGHGAHHLRGDFEDGAAGWNPLGTHLPSGLETGGAFAGSRSYHLRADGRGTQNVNKVIARLDPPLVPGDLVTLRLRARWLAGSPHLVVRLFENWMELSGALPTTPQPGTPGARNSVYQNNVGPAVEEVRHRPVLPAAGAPVVIRARLQDPDGVASARVVYRLDPAPGTTTQAMTAVGGGYYETSLPGRAAGTLLAFRVEATDGSGATTTYPEGAPATREALVRFGATLPANRAFPSYQLWMRQADIEDWNERQPMSNRLLPATFVFQDDWVTHLAGARFRGSPVQRNDLNVDHDDWAFAFKFDRSEPFLGSRLVNTDHFFDSWADTTKLREKICYWIGEQLGHPTPFLRYIYLHINGDARGLNVDVSPPEADEFRACWFPGEEDGELFEIKYGQEFIPEGEDYKDVARYEATLTPIFRSDGTWRLESYRWVFDRKTNGAADDDYQALFRLVEAGSATEDWETSVRSALDLDGFFRACATRNLVADPFGYGSEKAKNAYLFQRADGRWTLLPWDLDLAMQDRDYSTVTSHSFFRGSEPFLNALYTHPATRRIYLDILREAVEGPLRADRLNPVFDAWQAALRAAGETSETGSKASVKEWLKRRRDYLLQQVLPTPAPFAVSTGAGGVIAAAGAELRLEGTAPLAVRGLSVNGRPYPVSWPAVDRWQVSVPIGRTGRQEWVVQALDRHDQPLTGLSATLTVDAAQSTPPPRGWVVIAEIHARPAPGQPAFIELANRSPEATFDLSGWRLDGVGATLPPGTRLPPESRLVLTDRPAELRNRHGAVPLVGPWSADLDPDGEILTLLAPGAGSGEEVVDEVAYGFTAPWPAVTPGVHSLQLRDLDADRRRPGVWTAEPPTPGSPHPDPLHLTGLPLVWINELQPAAVWPDNRGEPSPWVELWNAGDEAPPAVNPAAPARTEFLVPWGSVWKGDTAGVDRGVAWREAWGITDPWAYGPAPVGFGTTGLGLTLAANPAPTTYLRRRVYLEGLAAVTSVTAHLRCADGVVVYLNGTEVFRHGLPAGTVAFGDWATGGGDQTFALPLGAWREGLNSLAVEVHQRPESQSHLSFDAAVEVSRRPAPRGRTAPVEGLFLTTDPEGAGWWRAPATLAAEPLQPALLWADGDPTQSAAGHPHAPFTLSAGPGRLFLGTWQQDRFLVLDAATYGPLAVGASWGSRPDGDPLRRLPLFPSPGEPNASAAAPRDLCLNEWMADNRATLADPADAAFEDWIEIHNPAAQPRDLSGYGLTDDLDRPHKFVLPAGTVLPAGGYLLVWADEDGSQNAPGSYHANFKLSRDGETIGLFAPDGTLVDAVAYGFQTTDVAEGRIPDGDARRAFLPPTPGAANRANLAPAFRGVVFSNTLDAAGRPTLRATFQAEDPDGSAANLSFSLVDPPPGPTLEARTGTLLWPGAEPPPGQWLHLLVRVTDSGPGRPSVDLPLHLVRGETGLLVAYVPGWVVQVTWPTQPGQRHRLEVSSDLRAWQLRPALTAAGTSLSDDWPAPPAGSSLFLRVSPVP